MLSRYLAILFSTILLAACVSKSSLCPKPPQAQPVKAEFVPSHWSALPEAWAEETLLEGWPALLRSCQKLKQDPSWQALCTAADALQPQHWQQVASFYQQHFKVYRIQSDNGEDSGLVTGYYEPLLYGSPYPRPDYYAVYAPPADLLTIDLDELYPELKNMRLRGRVVANKVVPYHSRSELDNTPSLLAGNEIAWVADPVELFFLHIQGSGRIQFEDGQIIRVGYANQNGHPYRSIGRWLVEQGLLPLEQVSMQGIQAWARAHPQELNNLLAQNPSYVFFKLNDNTDVEQGPLGSLDVPLTPQHSVAVDRRYLPLGAPLVLSTHWPNSTRPLVRLVHAQDTGGAIRGPLRVDFFWGFGSNAGKLAGAMKQRGQLWLLWPQELPPPGHKPSSP